MAAGTQPAGTVGAHVPGKKVLCVSPEAAPSSPRLPLYLGCSHFTAVATEAWTAWRFDSAEVLWAVGLVSLSADKHRARSVPASCSAPLSLWLVQAAFLCPETTCFLPTRGRPAWPGLWPSIKWRLRSLSKGHLLSLSSWSPDSGSRQKPQPQSMLVGHPARGVGVSGRGVPPQAVCPFVSLFVNKKRSRCCWSPCVLGAFSPS